MTSTTSTSSATKWIGEVPSGWRVLEPRRVFSLRREPERPGDIHLTPSQKYGVLPQEEYVAITGAQVVRNLSGTTMQHVEAGDFISHLRTFQGGLELAKQAGKVSPAYTVVTPGPEAFPNYYKYVLKSRGYISQIASVTDQLRDGQSMRFPEFNETWLPVPPFEEQKLIADYLDRETAEIDAFMVDCSSMVTLLEEQELALEASLLARGLNRSVPVTKNHGILWLEGESIPSHWTRMKLGFLVRMKSGDAISSEDIEAEGPYPVFGGGGFRGYTSTWNITGAHVLIGRQGALCGKVFISEGDAFATEHAIVTYPKIDLDLRWLEGLLRFMNLGQYSQSAAQPGIGVESISKLYVPVPPISEQIKIGDSLKRHREKESALLLELKSAIALAHERRSALISAAVTGQIDVTAQGVSAAEQLRDELEVHV